MLSRKKAACCRASFAELKATGLLHTGTQDAAKQMGNCSTQPVLTAEKLQNVQRCHLANQKHGLNAPKYSSAKLFPCFTLYWSQSNWKLTFGSWPALAPFAIPRRACTAGGKPGTQHPYFPRNSPRRAWLLSTVLPLPRGKGFLAVTCDQAAWTIALHLHQGHSFPVQDSLLLNSAEPAHPAGARLRASPALPRAGWVSLPAPCLGRHLLRSQGKAAGIEQELQPDELKDF